MGRLSARSNPTGLREVERGRVAIAVSENAGTRYFSIARFDTDGLDLAGDLEVIAVARAGNTSQRFSLGLLSSWSRESFLLSDLDQSAPLRFRLLLRAKDDPRIVASIENLRTLEDRESESLLPMEPAKLGQLLWRLEFRESEGPILQFNSDVFPSAAGIENYLPFRALVLPEALRQVLELIARDPENLDDEEDPYSAWSVWLDAMGGRPPLEAKDDDAIRREWCAQIIGTFCERYRFASALSNALNESIGHD